MNAVKGCWKNAPQVMVIFIFLSVLLIEQAQATEWKIEVINGALKYTGIDVDEKGYPHIAFSGSKYAWLNEEKWRIDFVNDGSVSEGSEGSSIALDKYGLPHIVYHTASRYVYAYYDGEKWIADDSTGGGYSYTNCETSLALDKFDYPHFTYPLDSYLYYKYFDGSNWHYRIIENRGALQSEIKLDSNDHPHIVFERIAYGENNKAGYSWYDGANWHEEQIDLGAYVENVSLVLDADDQPHLVICSSGIKHVYRSGSVWKIDTIDTDWIKSADAAIDSNGNLHVAYCDTLNGRLKYAYFDGSWQNEVVDQGDIGLYVSIATDSFKRSHISYLDGSKLKYAHTLLDSVPEAAFETNEKDGKAPLTVQFADTTSGTTNSWLWDFGDGSTSTEINPIHVYNEPGNYDVTLTVSGSEGATTKVERNCVWTYTLPLNGHFVAYIGEIIDPINSVFRLSTVDCRNNSIVDQTYLPDEPLDISATRDGEYVFVSQYWSGDVIKFPIREPGSFKLLQTVGGANGSCVSPDDQYFYVASSTSPGVVTRFNIDNDAKIEIPMGDDLGPAESVSISPDGNSLFVSSSSTALVHYPDSDTPTLEKISIADDRAIVVTPNSRYVYAMSYNLLQTPYSQIKKIPLGEHKRLSVLMETIRLNGYDAFTPWEMAASPDSHWLYVTMSALGYGRLLIIDLKTDEVVKTIDIGSNPRDLAFTTDGRYAYICSSDKVSVIDVERQELEEVIDFEGWPFSLAIAKLPGSCVADFDGDDDVDGSDIIEYIKKPYAVSLADFGSDFGTEKCP